MQSFVKTAAELANSVRAFMDAPEYWRDAVGSHPKYFVHIDADDGPLFGLSKFCAFREISLEDYVVELRHTTGGGATQKHIRRICGKDWLPLTSAPRTIQRQFKEWFASFTDGKLGFDGIQIMTINKNIKPNKPSIRAVSPEELQKRLAAQTKIGQIGEEIAMAYELTRLKSLGAVGSSIDLEHVSLRNTAAGFDIRSSFKKATRYIEVKSSTSTDGSIYVSPNEISTLQKHGESAFLYVVHVTDVVKRKGRVVQVIRNPFMSGRGTEWVYPALFVGKPPPGDSLE